MPHLDPSTGDLVLRVVYDGAPHAGKTTNLRALHGSLLALRDGSLTSPGSGRRRTEFFDWRDFHGGYLEGRALRCQVLSVPGQPDLRHRRLYLLAGADVVVCVLDSHPDRLADNRATLSSLRRLTEDSGIPVVLQLNKLDLAGALDAETIRAELGIDEEAAVFDAQAIHDQGVSATFLHAMRLAMARAREMLERGEIEAEEHPASPEELYRAVLRVEPGARSPVVEVSESAGAAPAPPAPPAAAPLPEEQIAPPEPPRSTSDWYDAWPGTLASLHRLEAVMAAAEPFEEARSWAPAGAAQWRGEGYLLHTSPLWLYRSPALASELLLRLSREQRTLGLEDDRLLLLAREGEALRLWVATRDRSDLPEAARLTPDHGTADPVGKGDVDPR